MLSKHSCAFSNPR